MTLTLPHADHHLRIVDSQYDDTLNAISEFIENHAETYRDSDGLRDLMSFREFRLLVEYVACEAVPNKITGWINESIFQIPFCAVKVSTTDEHEVGGQLRQKAVYLVREGEE